MKINLKIKIVHFTFFTFPRGSLILHEYKTMLCPERSMPLLTTIVVFTVD